MYPRYEGGTRHCLEGAWNLYKANGGGKIVEVVVPEGPHFYYFPPGAKDETPAQNLGEIEGMTYFPARTLVSVMAAGGTDWTEPAKRRFKTGKYVSPFDDPSVLDDDG
jgi:hypothetical protein